MGIQYPEVCPMELDIDGVYYGRHVDAMTREDLHSKSDIAIQLAWRDREIDRLRAELAAKSKDAESKDAERYRWLIRNWQFDKEASVSLVFDLDGLDDTDKADAAIDSAMGEGNGR